MKLEVLKKNYQMYAQADKIIFDFIINLRLNALTLTQLLVLKLDPQLVKLWERRLNYTETGDISCFIKNIRSRNFKFDFFTDISLGFESYKIYLYTAQNLVETKYHHSFNSNPWIPYMKDLSSKNQAYMAVYLMIGHIKESNQDYFYKLHSQYFDVIKENPVCLRKLWKKLTTKELFPILKSIYDDGYELPPQTQIVLNKISEEEIRKRFDLEDYDEHYAYLMGLFIGPLEKEGPLTSTFNLFLEFFENFLVFSDDIDISTSDYKFVQKLAISIQDIGTFKILWEIITRHRDKESIFDTFLSSLTLNIEYLLEDPSVAYIIMKKNPSLYVPIFLERFSWTALYKILENKDFERINLVDYILQKTEVPSDIETGLWKMWKENMTDIYYLWILDFDPVLSIKKAPDLNWTSEDIKKLYRGRVSELAQYLESKQ